MTRKGFHHVAAEQTRAQLIDTLRHLRDSAIRMAKARLEAGEWRMALTCLGKAAMYDEKTSAVERGDEIPPGY